MDGKFELISYYPFLLLYLPQVTVLNIEKTAQNINLRKYTTHLNYVSQDFGEYSWREEFCNLENPVWNSLNCDILCDITKMSLEDCSFDNVLCTEILEHLTDPQVAVGELSRVLKINAQMLITASFRSIYHQEPYFFYSGFVNICMRILLKK